MPASKIIYDTQPLLLQFTRTNSLAGIITKNVFHSFLTWRKVYLKEVYIQEEKYKDNEEEGK